MELRKVDDKNIWKVVKLSVNDDQKDFVATNTESILEAYTTITSGKVALPFGIYDDNETLVGFVMFGYDSSDDDNPEIAKGNYCIWRFMIDKAYQGKGLGRKALESAVEYVRTNPCGHADCCWLSYEKENVAAKSLYNSMGFIENGQMCDDEVVAVLKLNK